MVESGALEVSEETVADALEFGHAEIRKIVAAIRELRRKREADRRSQSSRLRSTKRSTRRYGRSTASACATRSTRQKHPKLESYGLVDAIKAEIMQARFPKRTKKSSKLAYRAFERLRERIFRDDMLVRRRRPDARAFDQVRQITCEVGVLPRVHGSALFTRGETQALATATLGTKEDKQRLDLLFEEEAFKRFMLHYNFPPFSVGEVKFLRGPGRREIGHGALAERALATCFRRKRISRTRCAWFRTFWNRTGRLRWPPSAAVRLR